MIKSKDLLGLPLISIADAKEVGAIGGFIFNPEQKSVDFLLLEKKEGEDIKGIPYGMIEGVGDFAVTVTDSNLIINIMKVGLLKKLVEKEIRLMGSRLITNKGKYLGQVTEYSIDTETGVLGKLFYAEQTGKEESIEAQEIITIGQDVVIVSTPSTETRKKTREISSGEREEILRALSPQRERKEEVKVEKEEKEKKEEKRETGQIVEEKTPPAPVEEEAQESKEKERVVPVSPPKEETSDPAKSIIERKRNELVGKTLIKDIKTDEGRVIARADTVITNDIYNQIQELGYEVFIEMATSVKD